jgi:hypothetical protein
MSAAWVRAIVRRPAPRRGHAAYGGRPAGAWLRPVCGTSVRPLASQRLLAAPSDGDDRLDDRLSAGPRA